MLIQGDEQGATAAAESYAKIFGADKFLIEVQSYQDDDIDVKEELTDLANKMGLGLVATNDVHFLNQDDYEAHNCLCCISTGKSADDPNRRIYPKGVFLKSTEQMHEEFKDISKACDNTLAIAR